MLQPVVMHPVAGAGDIDEAGIPEMGGAAVLLRVADPAFQAAHQQGRAGDPRPEPEALLRIDADRAVGAAVIVELPAVGAVLVLVGAVDGEVPGLGFRQAGIGLLHPPVCVFERVVTARQPAGKAALGVDPLPEPVVDGPGPARLDLRGRGP